MVQKYVCIEAMSLDIEVFLSSFDRVMTSSLTRRLIRDPIDILSGLTLLPRLIWWPFRSLFLHSTISSYFRASSIELYFIQCVCENILRCFSVHLQVLARLTTLEIVHHMHEHINRIKYPLLSLLQHRFDQPWLLPISMNLIDAKLISKGLSIFFRQAD